MSADRREEIADAGIAIIADLGMRALTHRAIDARLGLPAGSTSYYARSRRELLALIAQRLAQRTSADLDAAALPSPLDETTVAAALAALLEVLARRSADDRARFVLLLELRHEPELHGLLSHASAVRARLLHGAAGLLGALGVPSPGDHAPGLAALLDGLLFDRVAGSAAADAEGVIRAYLIGLRAGSAR